MLLLSNLTMPMSCSKRHNGDQFYLRNIPENEALNQKKVFYGQKVSFVPCGMNEEYSLRKHVVFEVVSHQREMF